MGEYDISQWRLASTQIHTPSDPKMATRVRTGFIGAGSHRRKLQKKSGPPQCHSTAVAAHDLVDGRRYLGVQCLRKVWRSGTEIGDAACRGCGHISWLGQDAGSSADWRIRARQSCSPVTVQKVRIVRCASLCNGSSRTIPSGTLEQATTNWPLGLQRRGNCLRCQQG